MAKTRKSKAAGAYAKSKGARGERELAKYFRDKGYKANRGRQYSGSPESPDVVVHALPHIHVECKRRERFTPAYYEQAEKDAFTDQVPVVVWKKNNGRWFCFLSLDDFITLVRNEGVLPDMPEGASNLLEDDLDE